MRAVPHQCSDADGWLPSSFPRKRGPRVSIKSGAGSLVPAFGDVIKSSPRHLPPNGTGFGIDDGCFSRPVVELAVREPAKAPLNWPFGTHKIGAGDLITAPFAGTQAWVPAFGAVIKSSVA